MEGQEAVAALHLERHAVRGEDRVGQVDLGAALGVFYALEEVQAALVLFLRSAMQLRGPAGEEEAEEATRWSWWCWLRLYLRSAYSQQLFLGCPVWVIALACKSFALCIECLAPRKWSLCMLLRIWGSTYSGKWERLLQTEAQLQYVQLGRQRTPRTARHPCWARYPCFKD